MSPDNLADRRQAEPASVSFRRVKYLKDIRQCLLAHPFAGVDELELDFSVSDGRLQLQMAPFGHCLPCVLGKIQQHLPQQ